MSEPDLDAYALKTAVAAEVAAPDLPYRPPVPKSYRPRIALVGAGGISAAHLDAYRAMGLDVAVIANRTLSKAEAKRDEYFPTAEATSDIDGTLTRDDIEVVDITPHPAERYAMIETALRAGKHVLSQKPFVIDLDAGARLCDLADEKGVFLAVNQNGRWAPHLSWMREAVRAGLVGQVHSVDVSIHWNHGWIKGTAFENIDDLILYDFAVHWFDFLASFIGGSATLVYRRKGTCRVAGGAAAADRRRDGRLRRRPGLAHLRRRGPLRRRGSHRDRRQPRHIEQPRPRSRRPGRDPHHRGRHRPPEARGHVVQGRLSRHHGRAA